MKALVLSLFPGIGLLDRAFEDAGFCVVRGPDLLWGGDIRRFHPPAGHFEGIMGGPPCQDFSRARRAEPTGEGRELVDAFLQTVTEARPAWWLMENVPGSPDLPSMIAGPYIVQRLLLNATEFGSPQNRPRKFHFGRRPALPALVLSRLGAASQPEPACLATEGKRGRGRRPWPEFCRLQGLPPGFDLPGFRLEDKYRAVGNGVPYPLALALARAIRATDRQVTPQRLCECGCGAFVTGKQRQATVACRKRMERIRRAEAPPPGASQLPLLAA